MKKEGEFDCQYIYIAPQDVSDIELRIIRHRYGTETADSM